MIFIVTDLTRFQNEDIVCVAGVDIKTKKCVRPLPYIEMEYCKKLNILPGAKIKGKLIKAKELKKPHLEDKNYSELEYEGPCSSVEFEDVLKNTTYDSINEGFEGKIPGSSKVIPHNDPPGRSIISLKLKPGQITIMRDGFNPEKIKLHILDNDEKEYKFLPITDLGFYNLAISKQTQPLLIENLNNFIQNQNRIYLRIGLSRRYCSPDGRNGFWIQVNGIYTFPDFLTEVRTHSK
ncbi:MAG: hypothetical protein HYR79_08010 [Nitrospirae bacterium]|nr:hypothetical protein [Nitrospirota bacterium]